MNHLGDRVGSGGGGAHSHAGEGVGGPNSNEGTDTVVLWVPLWYLVRGMNELLLDNV
jgi:hypothetical protein